MAMTPSEQVAYLSGEAALWEPAIDRAIAEKDEHALILALDQGFTVLAMAGLIQWRHRLDDPRTALGRAVDIGDRAVEHLPEARLWDGFPMAVARYLGFLLGRSMAAPHRGTPLPAAERDSQHRAEVLLDGVILRALDGVRPAENWSPPPRPRQKLLFASYDCYVRLLAAEPGERAGLTAEAESHYRERARNAYYSGGSSLYGGGLDNDHMVDFVLAAILRKLNASELSEAHGWRW